MSQYERPPIGLVPREIRQAERVREIVEAIGRFLFAQKPIPEEWLEELVEIYGSEGSEYGKD